MSEQKTLSKKNIFGYVLGDLGECMTFSIMGTFLTRYFVNVAMIDMGILAVFTFIWKVFDGISNPIIGVFLDKMYEKHGYKDGKFRHWMLRSAPLIAITAMVSFTAPSFIEGMGQLVVVFTTYLLYELAYNLFNIPYGSLLSTMSKSDEERAKLSSARGIGGMMGNMIPLTAFPLIISTFESNPQLGYGIGVTVAAGFGFICCLCSYAFTEERYTSEKTSTDNQEMKLSDFFVAFKKNKPLLAMCIHGIFQGILMSISQTMGTYIYSDVFGNLAIMSVGNIIVLPLSILVLVISPSLIKKMGTTVLIRKSLIIGACIYTFLFVLHVTTDINVWTHMIVGAVANAFLSIGSMMQWGLVGEVIDYNEELLGSRIEGTIYGTFNMLRRLGSAIGGSAGVALLAFIGYDAVLSNMGQPQSAGTILGLKVLCVLAPAILAMGSWAAFRFVWKKTREI